MVGIGDLQATTGAPELASKLKSLPHRPGCYLFKNAAGEVIYVGKAVSLKNRVRSYFQSSRNHTPKVAAMVQHIADFEYIVTATEVEALILECNLIKQKSPWYNVRLKDDKAYPYLKVTDEPYPRVMLVRRRGRDGRYYGPYTDVGAVRMTLKLLRKLFPIRTCSLDLSGERNYRPCLLYHIGRCKAPCADLQSRADYDTMMKQVSLFLEGRHDQLVPALDAQMREAAERLEFERAAELRDQIDALQKMSERQKIVSAGREDQDVIGLAHYGDLACVQVFFVRDGKLIGREHFFLEASEGSEPAEVIDAFVQQYYDEAGFIPKELLLPTELEHPALTAAWLSEKKGQMVELHVPQRGKKRRLLEMVTENAGLVLSERQVQQAQRAGQIEDGLRGLEQVLQLPTLPRRIEAYDISNTQGSEIVASMVVLTDGRPDNAEYRRFKIKTVTDGPNDFASMQEAIGRRFARGLKEREALAALDAAARDEARAKAKFAEFPQLVLIDGGKGQLHAARDKMRELGVDDLPTIGLAKQFELIYVEDRSDPIQLEHDNPALHLLQTIRDEAHRFALTYHRKLRSRQGTRSQLDAVPGVGPTRKRQLIEHFGTLGKLRTASLAELYEVPGLPQAVAERIYEQLGARDADSR